MTLWEDMHVSFVTYQFGFRIEGHRSPRSTNNTVGCYDLFGKCHDYIDKLNKDQAQLKEREREEKSNQVQFNERKRTIDRTNERKKGRPWLKLAFLLVHVILLFA